MEDHPRASRTRASKRTAITTATSAKANSSRHPDSAPDTELPNTSTSSKLENSATSTSSLRRSSRRGSLLPSAQLANQDSSLISTRSRRSTASSHLSDVSSSFDLSQRGGSPLSAPATPATSVSTATNVSASVKTNKRALEQDPDEGLSGSSSTATSPTVPASSFRNSRDTKLTKTSTVASTTTKGKGKGKEKENTSFSSAAASIGPSKTTKSSSNKGKGTKRKKAIIVSSDDDEESKKPSTSSAVSPPHKKAKGGKKSQSGKEENKSQPTPIEQSKTRAAEKMAAKKSATSPTTMTGANAKSRGGPTRRASKGRGSVGTSASSRFAGAEASSSSCSVPQDMEVDEEDPILSTKTGEEERRKAKGRGDVRSSKSTAGMTTDGSSSELDDECGHTAEDGDDMVQIECGEDDHVDNENEEDNDAEEHVEDEDEEEEDEEDDEEDVGDEAQYDEDEDGEDGYGDGDEQMGEFGLNLRAMAGYMSGLSGRFRTLLASLRDRKDPSAQLVALQELSELLSISNEDMLAGYFPTESYVSELIYLMGGPKPLTESSKKKGQGKAGEDDDGVGDDDEDEENAIAIAAAAAGLDDGGEMKLLACRCLANLIEAMPYAAHSVVIHGAVPVLNSKLVEIEFIDLAEQVLQTLEKISIEYPSAIVREEGGIMPMLQYLDFFNIHVQRTAMTAAANCCRKLSPDSFGKIKDVMPIIQNVLSYSDQRLVESACRCIVRTVDSYRAHAELLEQFLTHELIGAVNAILLPSNTSGSKSAGGSSTTVNTTTYTEVLKALGMAARVSPTVAVTLLENNVVETLYHLLTGSPAPAQDGSGGRGPASLHKAPLLSNEADAAVNDPGAGALAVVGSDGVENVGMADVAVLQNLANRPKEQVQEALSLVAELLPPLPKDGIFDSRMYSEKAYGKRKAKLARAVAKQAREHSMTRRANKDLSTDSKNSSSAEDTDLIQGVAPSATTDSTDDVAAGEAVNPVTAKPARAKSERDVAKERAQVKRIDTLRDRQELVKRFTQLVLPTLVEVYAASVFQHVRSKALFGILKIVSFVEPEPLSEVLDNVPLASFVAAVLSTRDHASLVQGALQLVELLTTKMPSLYSALLRREGVMWEIEDIAAKEPTHKSLTSPSKASEKAKAAIPLVLPGASSSTTDASAADTSSASSSAKPSAAKKGDESVTDQQTSGDVSNGGSDLGKLLSSTLSTYPSPFGAAGSTAAVRPSAPGTMIQSITGHSITLTEAEDANIWRARILRDLYSPKASLTSSGGAEAAGKALEDIRTLVAGLRTADDQDAAAIQGTLDKIAELFCKPEDPISSFELLRSGLVDGLYSFAVGDSSSLPRKTRRDLLTRALMTHQNDVGSSAASGLVRRLQETLSRLENVEITTAINSGPEESKRSPTANVARQLRLKLVADETESSEIPKSCANLTVTIHAIASFQSLSDYLRPKIIASLAAGAGFGSLGSTSSRLSGVLAHFASTAGLELPPSLAAAAAAAGAGAGRATSTSTGHHQIGAGNAASTASTADPTPKEANEKPARRRSSRLSSKGGKDGSSGDSADGKSKSTEASSSSRQDTTSALSESKGNATDNKQADEPQLEEESEDAMTRRLVENLLQGEMEGLADEGPFTDEEYEEEEFIGETSMSGLEAGDLSGVSEDKTINLRVQQDGLKVEAKTPDGTRVATPSNDPLAQITKSEPVTSTSSSSSTTSSAGAVPGTGADNTTASGDSSSSAAAATAATAAAAATGAGGTTPTKASYSSALQKRPTDWHLEFEMEGKPISLDSTIYSAVHRLETSPERRQQTGGAQRYIWSNTYSIKFRKVAGPVPASRPRDEATPEPFEQERAGVVELPPSVEADAPYARILQLLRVLHDLNVEWRELSRVDVTAAAASKALFETAFVNNKLTAKLSRQLEEPMIVASSCMPAWSLDFPRDFAFLFPFETRYAFLQSTSFGYHRLINRWQNLQTREQGNSSTSRHDDSLSLLGRLNRRKVRISRSNILASAFKVFELYGTNSSLLEVEYFEEVGTGLGPTLEFYAMVSREFARRDLGLWRDDDTTLAAGQATTRMKSDEEIDPAHKYVLAPRGLFPAPIAPKDVETSIGKVRTSAFRVLGQFVAKALFDSRIIDVNFSPIFMLLILNHRVAETDAMLAAVDPELASSLRKLRRMDSTEIENMGLDFTLPGFADYELVEDGKAKSVTADNFDEYAAEVIAHTLRKGIKAYVRAFREGFDTIFPLSSMSSFTPDELVMLFGNTEEDWSEATLLSSVKPDHGYNADSVSFRDVIHIMSTFTLQERREFLQWLTGSPKLPIGGFAGLRPQLTIVKRPPEANTAADQTLPSVMTCVNFCKLPQFSTREVMRERLLLAMREGQASFHLS